MLKRLYTTFKETSLYVFLALLGISALISIYGLRHNNLTMVKLRDAVYVADKSGIDVNGALNDLRSYVYAHMNTNLSSGNNAIKPPIQLKYTYERLAAEAEKDANDDGLYTAAANYCQEKIPASVSISGRGRIDCVQDYILSHGGKRAAAIPTALYQFDFVSPSWSPDLAGWGLVMTALFILLTLAKLAHDRLWAVRLGRQS
jgi:hypothetical protein